jgi:formylglycine-generating enzyme required for sulfatase activity
MVKIPTYVLATNGLWYKNPMLGNDQWGMIFLHRQVDAPAIIIDDCVEVLAVPYCRHDERQNLREVESTLRMAGFQYSGVKRHKRRELDMLPDATHHQLLVPVWVTLTGPIPADLVAGEEGLPTLPNGPKVIYNFKQRMDEVNYEIASLPYYTTEDSFTRQIDQLFKNKGKLFCVPPPEWHVECASDGHCDESIMLVPRGKEGTWQEAERRFQKIGTKGWVKMGDKWYCPAHALPPPATLAGKEITVDLGNGVKLEMVLIPAGEFLMGSPDLEHYAEQNEKQEHRVRITKPFYLGKYLVTQEQWETVMGSNPSHFKGPQNPVEQVSWNDCQQFFNKLNARSSPGRGKFQLPSEAQWEYACRAGSKTTYCFGDDEARLGEYAWYDSGSGTHPVGEKKPNAWGLYDMHGNVWEWCQDWYDGGYYAESPTDDPAGPTTGSNRVIRGGSRNGHFIALLCRSAIRGRNGPRVRSGDLGLRVSRMADGASE